MSRLIHPDVSRFRTEFRPGRGWVVLDPAGRAASDPTPFRQIARRACAALQAEADRLAKRGPRPCLCCGREFASAGIHNRLCGQCRGGDLAMGPSGSVGLSRGKPGVPSRGVL